VRLSDYRADLTDKSVLIFIMLVFAFSLHAGAEQSSLSLFLNKDIGLSDQLVGWLYFIHANVMALLSIFDGFLADRLHSGGKVAPRLGVCLGGCQQ
jgi:hypothetical protein